MPSPFVIPSLLSRFAKVLGVEFDPTAPGYDERRFDELDLTVQELENVVHREGQKAFNNAKADLADEITTAVNAVVERRIDALQRTHRRSFGVLAALALVGIGGSLGVAYKSTKDERALLALVEDNDATAWYAIGHRPESDEIDGRIATAIAAIPKAVEYVPNIDTQYAVDLAAHTDLDGDGIFGATDLCPDITGEGNGCPAGDADADGVGDAFDHCPATAAEDGKLLSEFDDWDRVFASDIARFPENGCSQPQIAALVATCTGGFVVSKETKAKTDTTPDEGEGDYVGCAGGITIHASYIGETPSNFRLVASSG